MKGSIVPFLDRMKWAVSWYDPSTKKHEKIFKLDGHVMPITAFKMRGGQLALDKRGRPIPDRDKCSGYKLATRLLNRIQTRWEMHRKGQARFDISDFKDARGSDVLKFYEGWLDADNSLKPATAKGYRSYFRRHFAPYFTEHPIELHEIQLDTLKGLLKWLKTAQGLHGKSALNVMMALHACLDFAWRSKRIPAVPPFPRRKEYGIPKKKIDWAPAADIYKIIDAIPAHHQPIFRWMYLHLMRPAEACSLMWSDWDPVNRVFYVNRSISARTLVNSTKTGEMYDTPCVDEFLPVMEQLARERGRWKSPFIFVNPLARRKGKRYTNESLNIIWKAACRKVGLSIGLYAGMRHSRASSLINESGYTRHEVFEAGPWAREDSVKNYGNIEVERKRTLLRGPRLVKKAEGE